MTDKPIIPCVLLSALALTGGGCKTVVREHIISTINTGVGITLAENPQTQLYKVKAGFIRSQFYSVPTGKAVERPLLDDADKPIAGTGTISIRPDITPEIVSGIRAKSSAEHLLLGMDIAENFAVGKVAVNSAAATAMYIAMAASPATANAASSAIIAQQVENQKAIRAEGARTEADLIKRIDGMNASQLAGAGHFEAWLSATISIRCRSSVRMRVASVRREATTSVWRTVFSGPSARATPFRFTRRASSPARRGRP